MWPARSCQGIRLRVVTNIGCIHFPPSDCFLYTASMMRRRIIPLIKFLKPGINSHWNPFTEHHLSRQLPCHIYRNSQFASLLSAVSLLYVITEAKRNAKGEKALKTIKKPDTLPLYNNVSGTSIETMLARQIIFFLCFRQALAHKLRLLHPNLPQLLES